MAELATIARPYAEALFQVVGKADIEPIRGQLDGLARLTGDENLRQFADHPKTSPSQVFDLMLEAVGYPIAESLKRFLLAVLENGRMSILPAVAKQFHELAGRAQGVSEALIESAFPVDDAQLKELTASLETRFGRKLSAIVALTPNLIGGVRVTVGDEVLDTSVRARLETMKFTLTA
jgi:F-type H+-transporting ATPase subunit delta